MEWFVNNYLSSSKFAQLTNISVLDVGSYDVNGSYKTFFQDTRFSYTGLDMEAGPNVDIVTETPYAWTMLQDESFDVVISGQAFEHIEFFWLTFGEMVRVLKRGGLICVIAPRGFECHRHPVDCYRFDADGMLALAKYYNLNPLHASTNLAPPGAHADWYSIYCADSMLIVEKPVDYPADGRVIDPKSCRFVLINLDDLATGFVQMSDVVRRKLLFQHPMNQLILAELQALTAQYNALINSSSWKITKPLRVLKKFISR
jgi:SAM-dependent methyltransferase